MSGAEAGGRKVRFGVFELDPHTGELRKAGLRIRLQEQPLRILLTLLERPGGLVTRDELRKKLWPDDTFVDFDQGLGTAIRKLREALGDTADNPRFIETLPRRGFRFIAPVNWQSAAATAMPVAVSVERARYPKGQFLYRRALPMAIAALGVVALAYVFTPSPSTSTVSKIVQLTNDGRLKSPIIVTDGSRVYFSEVVQYGRGYTPSVVSASGGEVVPIPINYLPGAPIVDMSPDGNNLLLLEPALVWPGSEGPLWVVPAVGGVPRRLGRLIAHEARWSPDGEQILYTRINDDHLYIAKANGTGSRSLATLPGQPYYISWSPDGKLINFTVEGEKSRSLWQVSADGTNLKPVLPLGETARASSSPFPHVYPSAGPRVREDQFPETASSGAWTPDGKYFLFEWARGGPHNIWLIRERESFFERPGTKLIQLTDGPLSIGGPVASRDERRIFVVSEEQGPRLERYDANLNEWKPFLSGIAAEHVNISRDGQRATYISYPNAILFRSKLDGSQKLQLTDPPEQAAMPRFSPDGNLIAYMSRTPGERWRIRLISSDGGASQQLTSGDFEETEPSWSPDGRYLALCRSATSKFPVDGPTVIYLIEVGSTKISQIPASGVRYYPRWSPNGRYIAATGDEFHKIMLFDLVSHQWITLFKKDSKEPVLYNLSWSHDGESIYFIDWSEDAPGYYRVRLRDRRIEKVVGLGGDVPTINGTIGGWVGLYNDSLIALLNREHGEIYALEWNAP